MRCSSFFTKISKKNKEFQFFCNKLFSVVYIVMTVKCLYGKEHYPRERKEIDYKTEPWLKSFSLKNRTSQKIKKEICYAEKEYSRK